MDHKLHLTDRVDARTGQISVDARGCLTQENYPALLRNLCGAARIVGGGMLVLDISRATHLDPAVLLAPRRLEVPRSHITAGTNNLSGADGISITLVEPRELPICLMHVGADGAVLAELDSVPGDETHAAGCVISWCTDYHAVTDGGEVSEFYDGTLDPGTTVVALSDHALEQLTDALYRHLDSPNPTFAAQTWFELASEETSEPPGSATCTAGCRLAWRGRPRRPGGSLAGLTWVHHRL